MKQAILELIDRKIDEYDSPLRELSAYRRATTLLQELRSEIEKMEEWIAVSDRLPENSNDILMKGTFGFLKTAIGRYHHTGENGFVLPNTVGFYKTETVTHWMPLPPNN